MDVANIDWLGRDGERKIQDMLVEASRGRNICDARRMPQAWCSDNGQIGGRSKYQCC